jgi:hypothetical protein
MFSRCVNNSVVQAIEASLAPRLISLDLSRTGSGSTLAFIRLIQHAPVLQELHVDNVEMEHLVALQSCLNIQQIHCQYLLPSILTTADVSHNILAYRHRVSNGITEAS